MSKDQYTVNDVPDMKPKTVDVQLQLKGDSVWFTYPNRQYENSAKEYVEELVKAKELESNNRVDSVVYWVNVKADK